MQLANHFLIAVPAQAPSMFSGSVVYITEYNPHQGAIGVIINKPISQTLMDMFNEIDIAQYNPNWAGNRLYLGGPVKAKNGFFLRKTIDYKNNTYELTGNQDLLAELGKNKSDLFMSVGYSEWSPMQLESEIGRNNWLVIKGNDNLIFNMDPAIRYSEALKLAGVNDISSLYFSGDVFA